MYKIRLNRRRWNLSTEMNWNNKPGLCSIVVHLTQTTAPEYYKPYMYKVYIKYTGGLFFFFGRQHSHTMTAISLILFVHGTLRIIVNRHQLLICTQLPSQTAIKTEMIAELFFNKKLEQDSKENRWQKGKEATTSQGF